MKNLLITLLLGLLLVGLVTAQESQTPYEIALERIEEAEARGATELHLERLGLTELPPEIGNLGNLERLDLSVNQLSSLPPEIGDLSNLQVLYLASNQLSYLPSEIGNLGNLKGLQLGYNQLSSLPPEIGNLGNLQWLDLSVNELSSLLPEIGNLGNLEGLYSYNNQLSSLPSEIGHLERLRRLDLSDNQLSSLPPEIGQMEALCFLDLSNNRLQHLPTELGQLGQLSEPSCLASYSITLSVDNNPVISPPQEVLAQGTPAILAYLRDEAWWHLQRLFAGGTGAVGLVAAIVLGWRWKNRRGYEKKKKHNSG